MKYRRPHLSDIAKELDLPEDICSGGFRIELFSDTVVIDGCKNVAEYGGGAIKLNTGRQTVGVFGDNLTIKSFVCSQAVITGKIISVELE